VPEHPARGLEARAEPPRRHRRPLRTCTALLAALTGVQFLLLEPNASDPLNKEAAEELRNNKEAFRKNSRAACRGLVVHGELYDRVTKV
jgi:hypothetical protein